MYMKQRYGGVSAAIISLLFGVTLSAQTATTAMANLTPKQLHDGSAKLVEHYSSEKKLRLVIGLQHPHLAEEEEFLKELGTKGSPNFQKFLTAEQWNTRFGPSAEDEQAVVDWATGQGLTVSRRFSNRLLVDLEGPAATIEKAFGVTMNSYQVGTRTTFSNDRDPVIPSTLSKIMHSVGGLNNIQVLRPTSKTAVEPAFADYTAGAAFAAAGSGAVSAMAKRPTKATGPTKNISGGAYDPTDIYGSGAYDVQALYNQGHCCNPLNNANVTPPSSSIAIATAGTQSTSDFAGFQASYPYLAYHFQQYYVDGTPACCDGEGTLDFDWSTAWSNSFGNYQNTAMIYMYDGVNNNFSTFTDVYNQILSDKKAMIFSTSWGCEETSCTPNSVMDTDHGIFNAMVGQGMTLVAATGDQGATAGCGDAVAVQYPASDPNVVGAGGTTLLLNSSSNYFSETAWSGGPEGCGSNDGGSTGGYSSYYPKPAYQSSISGLGSQRYVPDIALNADFVNSPQNFYYGGYLQGNGGTSIVAPSIAGFFAQTNAYLDYVATVNGGCYGTTTCTPIGNGNYYLYYFGENNTYAPHYPFYDITSGCNNNDITAYYGLGYFCTAPGYDPVTGWGSFNALQLTRAITTYRAYFGTTTASFSGYTQPTVNQWYNTDQEVQWTISGTGQAGYPSTGVAGFSQGWDSYIYDSTKEATPGSGDSFYSGPQFPNATYGNLYVSSAGQGCHTAQVLSWDNSGGSGYQTYGPVCYDTVAPVSSASVSGTTIAGGIYTSSVKVTLSASDASSGVKSIFYKLDGAGYVTYGSAFTVSTLGSHTVTIYSTDVAGNTEKAHSVSFSVESATATTVSSSLNPSLSGQSVTLTARTTATSGSVPTGTVTFNDGTTTLGTGTLSAGQAIYTTSTLALGSHSIKAVYNGSTTDATSSSTVSTQVVNPGVGVVSLSPASGSGSTQVFTAVYSDTNGASDLTAVRLLFNTAINGVNSCYASYSPASNTMYLENNSDNGTVGPLTPGSSSSIANSQCTLAGAGSSVTSSGNNMTVKFSLTFSSSFTGAKNAYLAANNVSTSSGWVQKGTWTAGGTGIPATVSLTPASGAGLSQTFTAVYSDTIGASDFTSVRLLFNTAVSGVNACYVSYSPESNALYLENNADNGTLGPLTPGSSSSISNSQCTLGGAGSSVSSSGNNMTVKFAVTFASSFSKSKNAYLAANNASSSSGWTQKGTWTPASVGSAAVVSLSPASGTGLTQTFVAVYSDPNGTGDLTAVHMLFNTAVSGANACYVSYSPATNTLYLENNANNGTVGPLTPGSASSISNSQCTLAGTGTSVSTSGNNMTVNYALTFSGTFTGSKNAYLAANGTSTSSGWVEKGTWTP